MDGWATSVFLACGFACTALKCQRTHSFSRNACRHLCQDASRTPSHLSPMRETSGFQKVVEGATATRQAELHHLSCPRVVVKQRSLMATGNTALLEPGVEALARPEHMALHILQRRSSQVEHSAQLVTLPGFHTRENVLSQVPSSTVVQESLSGS